VERNTARAERDDLRMEVAFQRAAGSQFVDAEAAWKLADKSRMTVAEEGTVTGAEEVVEALIEDHPFLLAPAPDAKPKDRNPFNEARSSGRNMNGKKKPQDAYNLAELERKYPSMRGRR
jgi:hypothetical protein